MKKLIIVLTVLCFSFSVAQAQDNNWFIRGGGGASVKINPFDKTSVTGSTEINFLKNVYKHIYLVGVFQNQASDWEDYAGEVIWFTSNPDPTKISFYLLTSGGYTHSGSNNIDDGSLGVGLGTVFSIFGVNPYLEGSFKRVTGDWIAYAKTGLQIELKF